MAPFCLIICLHIFLYYPRPTMQSSLLGLWIHYSHRHNIIFLLVFIIYSLTLRKIQVKNGNILPFSAAGNLLLNHSNKILYYYYLEMLMFPVLICTRKGWSAFDRLVPPGGSIGCVIRNLVSKNSLTHVLISLDDKLFNFWLLQGDSYPFARVKGIFRFETGIKVTEFRDLRANPRCLLESQILSFRVKWSQMMSTGVLGSSRKTGVSPTPPLPGRSANGLSSLGVPFDPYDYAPLPSRILTTGAAANFPSVANLVGDVFNAPVFVPLTQVDSAQVVPHRNAPAQGYPSRAALGAAYIARWVWGREWGSGGLGVFEDEMKRLLGKHWVATGGNLENQCKRRYEHRRAWWFRRW